MADAEFDRFGGPSGPADARRLGLWVRASGGIVSLALVAGLGVWGYRLAVRDVTGVPVLQALDGPMRIAPENPGGEVADHQGLAVNTVAAAGIAAPLPERLVLAPRPTDLADEDVAGLAGQPPLDLTALSAPLTAPVAARADLSLAAAPPMESASPTEIAIDAALAEALGLEPEPAAADPDALAAVDIPPADAILVSPRPLARPVARASAAAPKPATILPEVTEVDPATIPLGTRLVQFGTFDTTDEARGAWALLQGRFGALMDAKAMVLQPAESNGRTFWRLRAHGFADEADARRFCLAFVAEGATCIPVPQR
jgi:hypothetical protein